MRNDSAVVQVLDRSLLLGFTPKFSLAPLF